MLGFSDHQVGDGATEGADGALGEHLGLLAALFAGNAKDAFVHCRDQAMVEFSASHRIGQGCLEALRDRRQLEVQFHLTVRTIHTVTGPRDAQKERRHALRWRDRNEHAW